MLDKIGRIDSCRMRWLEVLSWASPYRGLVLIYVGYSKYDGPLATYLGFEPSGIAPQNRMNQHLRRCGRGAGIRCSQHWR